MNNPWTSKDDREEKERWILKVMGGSSFWEGMWK